MRRLAALAAAALLLSVAGGPAGAHNPARLVMTAPADGARVTGPTVHVVVEGQGGTAAALFRLDLDGQTVDATGRVGGVFSTLSVEPGGRLELDVAVAPGEHTLTATPNPDPDAKQVTVVRRFTVAAGDAGDPGARDAGGGTASGGGFPVLPVALAAVVAVAAAGAVAWRRRTAR